MISVSYSAWIYFLFSIIACTFITVRLTIFFPWNNKAVNSGFPLFFGMSLAPFLFGVLSLIALFLFPNYKHNIHFLFILITEGLLVLIAFLGVREGFQKRQLSLFKKLDFIEKLAILLLLLFLLCLLVNSIFFPLTQNDSLEYATVGRILFEKPDLSNYPVLNSELNTSGFYAPWTHPPLYAAMIYTSYLFQGDAEYAGLMRLISPWFAFCGVALTFAIGSLITRRVGLFSGIFLISTPLFFLGSDSALIDSLPILGLLLGFSSIVAIKSPSVKSGIIQGTLLGLAMWTHSQSILFLPLCIVCLFVFGRGKIKYNFLKQCVVLVTVCIFIAAFPYLRNILIYGTLVSDSNTIYQLSTLEWSAYFREARGINSFTAILQYGIFKGWFAIEYFGFIFWLMIFALIYLLPLITKLSFKNILDKFQIVVLSFGIVCTYLLGIIVSIFFGLDIMIRNERYWLVILPFVSIIAGWFYSVCIDHKSKNLFLNIIRLVMIFSFVFLIMLQFTIFATYRFLATSTSIRQILNPLEEKQLRFSELQSMSFLKKYTRKNAVIYATQPANMFYSARKMVSYLDPRLLNFYLSTNPQEGMKILKRLGITHIYITDYSLPIFYNSQLMNIVANPSVTKLIYSSGGSQIYLLDYSKSNFQWGKQDSNSEFIWIKHKQYRLLGKKGGFVINTEPVELKPQEVSISQLPFNLFQRNFSTLIASEKNTNIIHGGSEYVIELSLTGKGFLSFYVTQFDKFGNALKDKKHPSSYSNLIGNLVLENDAKPHKFLRRIKTLSNTYFIEISIEQEGNSSVAINRMYLNELTKEPSDYE